ncbi:MAG: FoF1 ATP synthase subunit a [Bacilli bacterium]|jgi:F-type H+-transporting ATPase subunit a
MNFLIQSTLEGFPGEIYSSILVVMIIFVICLIVYVKVRKTDPLAKPKGIVHLAEILVTTIDGMVKNYISPKLSFLGGYFTAVAMYMFLGFTFSLFGLPSPTTYLMVPLIFALITFLLIHGVSVYYSKWKYFKRYTAPVFIFLPINLVTMWAPVLSLSFRLFGNALAGWVLMAIIYDALGGLSAAIFSFLPAGLNSIFIAPLVASWLHIYFDLISAFIQTMVFVTLSMIFIGQEVPEDDIVNKAIAAPREA